jgi:hypothetical protein
MVQKEKLLLIEHYSYKKAKTITGVGWRRKWNKYLNNWKLLES